MRPVHEGQRSEGYAHHRNQAKSGCRGVYHLPTMMTRALAPHERFVKTSGLRWTCVVLFAEVSWASRVWGLPFVSALAYSRSRAKLPRDRHEERSLHLPEDGRDGDPAREQERREVRGLTQPGATEEVRRSDQPWSERGPVRDRQHEDAQQEPLALAPRNISGVSLKTVRQSFQRLGIPLASERHVLLC
jgi:hypothetical protein